MRLISVLRYGQSEMCLFFEIGSVTTQHPLIFQLLQFICYLANKKYPSEERPTSTILLCDSRVTLYTRNFNMASQISFLFVYKFTTHPWVPVTTAWRLPWVADGVVGLQIYLISSRGQPTRSGPPAWVWREANNLTL